MNIFVLGDGCFSFQKTYSISWTRPKTHWFDDIIIRSFFRSNNDNVRELSVNKSHYNMLIVLFYINSTIVTLSTVTIIELMYYNILTILLSCMFFTQTQ